MNEIILNIHPLEKRLAILEDNKLVELVVETKNKGNIIGNIYKGIVKDILPGMGAAFIDIGLERTAFLHYSDIVTDFFNHSDEESDDDNYIETHKSQNGDSSKIEKLLTKGQEIVVQVQKGPINKKGARVTGQISIPGKYLVLFPNKSKIAISKKISSGLEKGRIKNILSKIKAEDVGLIVRTDAEGNSEEEFNAEYQGLYQSWLIIEQKIKNEMAPACMYEQNDLTNKLVRDYFNSSIDRMVINDRQYMKRLVAELKDVAPELTNRIELYHEDSPIFDAFGIEKEIEKIFQSNIPLPSGGNIVIEQTEAFVTIDVNTGSFIGNRNYESTVKRTNLEAAVELVRQIRLRDLSGIVIVDFIDMASESHKNEVFDMLKRHLKRDRAKNKAYYFGPLGLVEITRKRTGPGLLNTYSQHCQTCNGTGRVLSKEAIAMKIHRSLERAEYFAMNKPLTLVVNPEIREYLSNYPDYLKGMSLRIILEEEEKLPLDKFKVFLDGKKKELTIVYSA